LTSEKVIFGAGGVGEVAGVFPAVAEIAWEGASTLDELAEEAAGFAEDAGAAVCARAAAAMKVKAQAVARKGSRAMTIKKDGRRAPYDRFD
jgi:hypothetical protein